MAWIFPTVITAYHEFYLHTYAVIEKRFGHLKQVLGKTTVLSDMDIMNHITARTPQKYKPNPIGVADETQG